MILGIDPGKNHTGMCLYDPISNSIVSWGLYDVDDRTPHAFLTSFRARLDDVLGDAVPTTVCIERQPPKNSAMCRISQYMHMVIAISFPDAALHVVPPTRRIKYVKTVRPDLPCTTYAQRKQSSICVTQTWLEDHDSSWKGWFHDQSKKDDCAESFLLCLVPSTAR